MRVASGESASGAVDGVGELLVVDHHVDVFPVDHLGQRRTGERGVQQQHVGADAGGRDQRLDEAAVVAAHDPDGLRAEFLQCGGQCVGALGRSP